MNHTYKTRIAIALIVACLTLPLAAQAQTFPTCKVTTGTWNGNLGGIAGADAKCAADARTTGYRFARTYRSILATYNAADVTAMAWTPASQYNCSQYTQNSGVGFAVTPTADGLVASTYGAYQQVYFSITPGNSGYATMGPSVGMQYDCAASLPIWCCNF